MTVFYGDTLTSFNFDICKFLTQYLYLYNIEFEDIIYIGDNVSHVKKVPLLHLSINFYTATHFHIGIISAIYTLQYIA